MNELFKGYVLTKDKKSIEKFKNRTDLKQLDDVKGYTEYAGVLADDVVLIDVDNHDESEILFDIVNDLKLRCLVIETSRGKHFYFKNTNLTTNKTHTKLACGITADIKLGCKTSYAVLKFDGKNREVVYDKFDDEEYQEIPKILYPVKSNQEFVNMENGDGRNQALFNYILTLQSNNFNKEEIKTTITIINKHVLKEKLSDKELDVILRDDAFSKPNFHDGKQLDVNKFARFLIDNEHICKINYQNYIYNGQIYVTGKSYIEASMIKYIPNLLSAKRSEVLKMIDLLMRNVPETEYSPPNYIAFKNGIYDLNTDELLEFSPDIVITNQIPWDYNPNANNKRISEIIGNWVSHDNDMILLLEECIGMCMYRSNKIGACFMLTGDKDNGKSTFIDMLKALLGKDNYTTITLHKLEKRFLNADIIGKLADLGDDIGDEYICQTETFKKLVTGDTVQFERKGQDPIYYDNYGKLIFSANEIPTIKDPTGAVIDKRMIIVPFNVTYVKGTKNRELSSQFKTSKDMMETLILKGIRGIKRVLENDEFTTAKIAKQAKNDYQYKNDIVAQFIDEYGEDNIRFENAKLIITEYKLFCNDRNSKSSSAVILNQGLKRILGFNKYKLNIKKDNKVKTVYYYAKDGEVLPDEQREKLKK